MVILEKTFNPTEEEKEVINYLLGDRMPLYYSITTSDNFHFHGHSFLIRNPIDGEEGIINSDHGTEKVLSLFKRICLENNIKLKKVYRAALNTSTHYPDLHGDIHKDHIFDHYVFLMYLNDFDFGYTYIFDENKNLKYTIYPEKFKFVIFDGSPHAQGFCRIGQRRVVLAITFGMEE